MPKSLTRDLIFFISGCFVLTLIWPNLEYEFALYGVAIENGQWYRLFTGISSWRLVTPSF